MLHVADVVHDEILDAVDPAQLPTQAQIALSFQQTLDQR